MGARAHLDCGPGPVASILPCQIPVLPVDKQLRYLGGQELPPGRRRLPRRRPQPGGGQDPADRPLPTRYPSPSNSP